MCFLTDRHQCAIIYMSVCVCARQYFWTTMPLSLCPTGLNGRPVCMVRDDWNVTSSLFPHPLLKSHVHRKTTCPSFGFPSAPTLHGVNSSKSKSSTFALTCNVSVFFTILCTFLLILSHFTVLFSEAWREELKELSAKVTLSSQAQKDNKEVSVLL